MAWIVEVINKVIGKKVKANQDKTAQIQEEDELNSLTVTYLTATNERKKKEDFNFYILVIGLATISLIVIMISIFFKKRNL
ncbi:hypothetical protein MYP_653 [Sporocytophaga myxococcoides]|uniref:Uncharacterized protein n=1 Tax=Sporocytophaga myxococcoides TaxID=153721 RepID=A0A098L963_9BACT|nr:hypothetical protein [Sporocytophaga myxococcoides]GAL83426.1 hypothetical protein MYP_653 [Sporocytophaga myxococcoides]